MKQKMNEITKLNGRLENHKSVYALMKKVSEFLNLHGLIVELGEYDYGALMYSLESESLVYSDKYRQTPDSWEKCAEDGTKKYMKNRLYPIVLIAIEKAFNCAVKQKTEQAEAKEKIEQILKMF